MGPEPSEPTEPGAASDSSRAGDPTLTSAPELPRPPWVRGAMISAAGVLVGSLAFALFCYALGLNMSDEGWAADQQTNLVVLALSLAGFAVAILVFWLGFVQMTHARS